MEIRYIKHSDIDRKKWDCCIEKACNGTIYAMSWYLDATAYGWDALIAEDYLAVFPLPYRKRMGFHILYQPVSSQQLGVFAETELDGDVILRFLKAIPKKFLFGTLHLNAGNKITDSRQFPVEYRVNIELKLDKPVEQLRKNYIRNNRRNLIKAYRHNISVREGTDYRRIIDAFRDGIGSERYHVHKSCYPLFYRLFSVLQQKDILSIYEAYDAENRFVAGIMLASFKNRSVALFSGCTEEGYAIFASHLLFDYSIEQASKKKEIFDFEGSNTESLAFVFHGFGGKTVPYPAVTVSNIPPVFTALVSKVKKAFRK